MLCIQHFHEGGVAARRLLQEGGGVARRLLKDAAATAPISTPLPPFGHTNFSYGHSQYPYTDSPSNGSLNHFSPSVTIIMVVVLSAFFFMGFFSLYVRKCADGASSDGQGSLHRGGDNQQHAQQGVDPDLIRSLPLVAYSSAKKKGNNVECVVCLTDFEENEPLRQLPACKHVFHQDCIDMWLFSHSTCPLCRRGIARGSMSLRWGGGSGSFRQLPFLSRGGGSTAAQQLRASEEAGTMSLMTQGSRSDSVISIRQTISADTANVNIGHPASAEGMNGGSSNSNSDTTRASAMSDIACRDQTATALELVTNSRAVLHDRGTRRRQRLNLIRANSTGHSLLQLTLANEVNAHVLAVGAPPSAAGLCRSISEVPHEHEGDMGV